MLSILMPAVHCSVALVDNLKIVGISSSVYARVSADTGFRMASITREKAASATSPAL